MSGAGGQALYGALEGAAHAASGGRAAPAPAAKRRATEPGCHAAAAAPAPKEVQGWLAGHTDLPLLPEVVERIGFGLAQVRAGFVGGGVYFADGAELLLISSVTDAVAGDWSLGPTQRGLVVTIVFLGILVGNFSSGPIGDAHGRKQLIFVSFVGIFLFSMLSSISIGFLTLSISRFCVGVSFGIGQPAWNTLGAEVTPADYRVAMQAISGGFFVLGELYSAVLVLADDPQMKTLHWRWLLRMGAIPSAVFGTLCLLLMHQSPSYLAVSGQYDKAKEVLESMRYDNGHQTADVPVDFSLITRASQLKRLAKKLRASRRLSVLSKNDLLRQVRVVFGPNLWLSTLIVMYSCFVLNLLYYGCLYAFPQVLAKEREQGGLSAGMELFVSALWEIPGQALGIVCGVYLKRKVNMQVYLFTASLSLVSFVFGLLGSGAQAKVFQTIGLYGIKCFVSIGFVVIYQYSIEIYPTQARTTGTAVNMGSGRLAGIISPLIFELIVSSTGGYSGFFMILAGACILNLLLIPLLKYETFGMPLKDDVDDEEEGTVKADDEAEVTEVEPLLASKTTRMRGRTVYFAEPLPPRF